MLKKKNSATGQEMAADLSAYPLELARSIPVPSIMKPHWKQDLVPKRVSIGERAPAKKASLRHRRLARSHPDKVPETGPDWNQSWSGGDPSRRGRGELPGNRDETPWLCFYPLPGELGAGAGFQPGRLELDRPAFVLPGWIQDRDWEVLSSGPAQARKLAQLLNPAVEQT